MELIDTAELKSKLDEVELQYNEHPTEISKARLGIIYHETALNFSFLNKTAYKDYAKKSFDVLTELLFSETTTKELMPFFASYRASALSLVGVETRKIRLLSDAFILFNEAVEKFSSVSYLPEFLRGSVSEKLPWIFYKKRKFAKLDFQSIIDKYSQNREYANWKIMSFSYWAWANQRQERKHREQALQYLDKAIALDLAYKAGRRKAEELKIKMNQ